jgi:hypothetical protein
VRNVGRTTAHKVSICCTVLQYPVGGRPDAEFREEVLDLKLSLGKDEVEFRLAPGAHRFVDLCYVRNSDLTLNWVFAQRPLRFYDTVFGPGRYRLHVFASSGNSESVSGDVIFSWDGTFSGLRAVGFARS